MLKYRAPYPDAIRGSSEFLDGQQTFQAFAPRNSAETRVINNNLITTIIIVINTDY